MAELYKPLLEMSRSSQNSSSSSPKKQRSRKSIYDEEDAGREYRQKQSSKRKSSRYEFDEDEDEDEYWQRKHHEASRCNTISWILVIILALSIYFITFPEKNLSGINFNENGNTKAAFAKINKFKMLAWDKWNEFRMTKKECLVEEKDQKSLNTEESDEDEESEEDEKFEEEEKFDEDADN